MVDVFVGVLAALISYRLLIALGIDVLRAWVRHDRAAGLARNGSWSGHSSRPWRLMQRLGVEE